MSSSAPPLSNEELQTFVGMHCKEVMKHLEDIGYTVHLSRSGSNAFGSILGVALIEGQLPPSEEHRAMVNYNGDDPEQKCASIEQGYW